jgi:hypothetical protein
VLFGRFELNTIAIKSRAVSLGHDVRERNRHQLDTSTQYREAEETAVANLFQNTCLTEQAIFRTESEYWTIACG